MQLEEIRILLEKYKSNLCSEEELQQLLRWYEGLDSGFNFSENELASAEEMLADFRDRLARARVIPIKKKILSKVAVAASVAVILLGSVFIYHSVSKEGAEIAVTANNEVSAPDKTQARITLADGSIIYLDSVNSGQLAEQGSIRLVKLADGQVRYENNDGSHLTDVVYNTITNPRGSKSAVIQLSDGSLVWLNAGSSLRYPISFVGEERRVHLQGEGYFEIAKDAGKPFLVEAKETTTKVLGTHFNLNAYEDENDTRLTLLEGSVKISASKSGREDSRVIKPGQQVRVSGDKDLQLFNDVDLEEVMAWYNNEFVFENEDIHVIMRQLARWYDIEPVFTREDNAYAITNYTGRITKTVEISKVLELFENLGYIKFDIRDKKVAVVPTDKKIE